MSSNLVPEFNASLSPNFTSLPCFDPSGEAFLGLTDPFRQSPGFSGSGSSNIAAIASGTLDSTDPINPTCSGTFSDDYLLTGVLVGQQVQVNLDASFDTYLQLVNADTGAVLNFDDDSGADLNSQLTFSVEAGTDYILRTTSFGVGVTGNYTLTTSVGTSIPGTPISGNQTLTGTLSTTDPINPNRPGTLSDDYLLTGISVGQQIQVNLDAGFDTYLQLVNTDTGEILSFDDDSGAELNSQLTFTVEEGINYGIRATSFGANATGDYTLTTTTLNSLPPITSNQTLTGTLSPTDPNNPDRPGSFSDDYLLTGISTAQLVQVNLDAAFDAYLQLVNADTGELLNFDDDSGAGLNSQLAFTVEADTRYIIRATSFGAGAVGDYTLTTTLITVPDGFNANHGYGLVDAASAVASTLGQSAFPDVPNLGGDEWGRDLVNAPEVWAQGFTGEGIIVAVIDTGVDYNHSDLDANIWVNAGEITANGIDDDGNGYVDDRQGWDFVEGDGDPMDLDGHGTHVAGTIAAENNDFGVTGVAYDAAIMAVRVLDENGSGFYSDIAAGIRYATDNGANVINLSLGGGYSAEVEAAVAYAAGLGSVVVMAAGNGYADEPGYPAYTATDFGIAVGAIDITKTLADFSNDAGPIPLDYVVAPGVDVLSTTPGNTYQAFNGTSMATPHVAGVAALVLSANPNLSAAEVETTLVETADPNEITA